MEKKPAQRAEKHGICSRTYTLVRMNISGKCYETLALIFDLTPRQVRRRIESFKDIVGIHCMTELAVWLNAHGLFFANEEERADYLKRESELRKAA